MRCVTGTLNSLTTAILSRYRTFDLAPIILLHDLSESHPSVNTFMRWLRVLVAALVCVSASKADDWPQWRGPKNDGLSAEKNLPTEWSADKNVVWKLKMPGIGAGTPVVW